MLRLNVRRWGSSHKSGQLEMTQSFDLVLTGATIVNHDGEGVGDLAIAGGRIAAIGSLSAAAAGQVIDCRGLHVLPGVIDTQVHFREPGAIHKEDLETGSLGAVMGGVTAVFEMPTPIRPPPARWRSPTRSRAPITACIVILPSSSAARGRTPASFPRSSACLDARV
jgi:urease alpha subunit